ncbi:MULTISPECIES: zinc-dependent alcohol dehydrogenase family protein [Raoultella]|uniref:Zinc-dependent alcohol dehydrogenase family protein n=1 Tax=Raoultella lignicola TaxID=3040939 RepID=A0ABU9FBG4_9ENTR
MLNHALCYDTYGAPAAALRLRTAPMLPLAAGKVRVAMRYAPVNPSDLIPITGAYNHRTRLPATAGYEGVGVVVEAPPGARVAPGQRVLPLRGDGTWQRYLDIPERWLMPVPDAIDDLLAARAYINPLTALLMLNRWPVAGCNIVLTAAGSSCASLLAQWALHKGARSVSGVIRSPQHISRLEQLGVYPLLEADRLMLEQVGQNADWLFDAVGGALANTLLSVLPDRAGLISYGLLSGQALTQTRLLPRVHKFHLREALATLSDAQWQAAFAGIWRLLPTTTLPPVEVVPLHRWQEAIRASSHGKYLLDFTTL